MEREENTMFTTNNMVLFGGVSIAAVWFRSFIRSFEPNTKNEISKFSKK